MSKKFLFLRALAYIIFTNAIASSEIIPLKKPIQTEAETKKKLLIDVLRPLPKPNNKVENQNNRGKNSCKKGN